MNRLPLLATLLVAGCIQYGSIQTAATNGKGRFEGGVEAGVRVVPGDDDDNTSILTNNTLSLRYGITDRVDLGLRVGQNAYDVHGKVMFTKADAPVIVSFAPSFFSDDFGNMAFNTPVLLGIPLGPHELTLGPRVVTATDQALLGLNNGERMVFGSSLGFAAQILPGFKLLPEITMVAGAKGSFAQDIKLGFLFGGRRR